MSIPIRAGVGLCLFLLIGITRNVVASPVFINEIHYDNTGADTGEFVELVGVSGTSLDGWSLALYNGSNGSVYDTLGLGGVLADDTGTGFGFLVIDIPGLQNGSPDGIALADGGDNLIEFLSYEGSFTGVGGVADGVASIDIGVSESSATPVGWSLQLGGTGGVAADFSWQAPQPATPGAGNTGQTLQSTAVFNAVPLPPVLLLVLAGLVGMGRRPAA